MSSILTTKRRTVTLSLVTISVLFSGCAPAYSPKYQSDSEVMQQKEKNVALNTGGATILGGLIGLALGDKKGALIGAALGGALGYALSSNYNKELRIRKAEILAALERNNVDTSKVSMEDLTQESASYETTKAINDSLKKSSKEGEKVTIGQKVTFEDGGQFATDKDTLSADAEKMFREVAKAYAKSNNKVMIVGHTDDRASDEYNQALSERRAKTVARIFEQEGVPIENIYYIGKGESSPIATNKTEDGRAKNRRVEIVDMPNESDLATMAYAAPSMSAGDLSAEAPKIAPSGSALAKNNVTAGANGGSSGSGAGGTGDSVDSVDFGTGRPSGSGTGSMPSYAGFDIGGGKKVLNENSTCVNTESDMVYYGNALPRLEWVQEGNSIESGAQTLHASILESSGGIYNQKMFAQSFVAYANSEDVSSIGLPCYYDIRRNTGLLKRLSDGRTITPTKTALSSGYELASLRGTDNTIDIENVSINRKTFGAATCPMIRVNDPKTQKIVYASTSKVVTIGAEKGILYRIYPDDKSVFQCGDVVLPHDSKDGVAKGVFYHVEGNKVWGLPVELQIDNNRI